ncbi:MULTISPECIES: PilZ domain-containing protein [unclassified Novosphingobium]|uniref:PilZ domain-containing protein n=1 Tax=unclassified Novosphingobium TaxID=2644732 RepID=UPI001356DA0A|nr:MULTISPECIES: PilZ domain-containing protein [unclassified Novosphingobium]
MSAGARLTVSEMRGAARHPVDYTTTGEHRHLGELELHLVNISSQGFMIQGRPDIESGERIALRFPVIGRIEGHLVWSHEERAGFQFERIIRADDFALLVAQLQPNPRLRGNRG